MAESAGASLPRAPRPRYRSRSYDASSSEPARRSASTSSSASSATRWRSARASASGCVSKLTLREPGRSSGHAIGQGYDQPDHGKERPLHEVRHRAARPPRGSARSPFDLGPAASPARASLYRAATTRPARRRRAGPPAPESTRRMARWAPAGSIPRSEPRNTRVPVPTSCRRQLFDDLASDGRGGGRLRLGDRQRLAVRAPQVAGDLPGLLSLCWRSGGAQQLDEHERGEGHHCGNGDRQRPPSHGVTPSAASSRATTAAVSGPTWRATTTPRASTKKVSGGPVTP